jgi:hypothetical protein
MPLMSAVKVSLPSPESRHLQRPRYGSQFRLPGPSPHKRPSGRITPLQPVEADTNILIQLPLSGAQPTWRDLPLGSSRSKMIQRGLKPTGETEYS